MGGAKAIMRPISESITEEDQEDMMSMAVKNKVKSDQHLEECKKEKV